MPSSLPFDVTHRPCSCSVTMTHQRLFQWIRRVRLQRFHSLCDGILRPLTECQLLLNNGTSWKASVVTVEFVRPHCFGGLFPDDFLRASGDFQKALMKKSKQQKKSQTQRKAYICHDGLSHYVKAVFFCTHFSSYQQIHSYAEGKIKRKTVKLKLWRKTCFYHPLAYLFPLIELLCVDQSVFNMIAVHPWSPLKMQIKSESVFNAFWLYLHLSFHEVKGVLCLQKDECLAT